MCANSSELPRKSAFPPVVAANTRVLILGSLPGDASLAAGRYYAHPRNRFWHLVGTVIERDDLPALPYEARLDALLGAGIGLWDTIASAHRPGSLDAAIRDVTAAPLRELVATLPALAAVAFNGAASARIGRRALSGADQTGTGPALIDLPSSSPANAAVPLLEKERQWRHLQQFLASGLQAAPART